MFSLIFNKEFKIKMDVININCEFVYIFNVIFEIGEYDS